MTESDSGGLTPKQRYEARKAKRQKFKELEWEARQKAEQIEMLDMVDRFVTAFERIADALERLAPTTLPEG